MRRSALVGCFWSCSPWFWLVFGSGSGRQLWSGTKATPSCMRRPSRCRRVPQTSVLRLGLSTCSLSPLRLYNSPHLNDLATRSNGYLSSKIFFLTTDPFHATLRHEIGAPAKPSVELLPSRRLLSSSTVLPAQTPCANPILSLSPPWRDLCVLRVSVANPIFSAACRLFCLSLPSSKKSTPLQSSKSSLFLQNTGVGVPQHIRVGLYFRRHMHHVPLYPLRSQS